MHQLQSSKEKRGVTKEIVPYQNGEDCRGAAYLGERSKVTFCTCLDYTNLKYCDTENISEVTLFTKLHIMKIYIFKNLEPHNFKFSKPSELQAD